MAVTMNFRILVVCSCLALTAASGTKCFEGCALCLYTRAQVGEGTKASMSCTLECEGNVDIQKLEMCRNLLTEKERTAADSLQGKEAEAQQKHQLAKTFGSFMKRNGDLIMKNTAELGDDAKDHFDGETTKLMSKRYGGFMKKDTAALQEKRETGQLQALLETLNVGDARLSEDGSKHYDGFMRSPHKSQGDVVRYMQKRYGGFMRRVGRPEWLIDPKVYGGLTKRFLEEPAETSIPNMEKKYGGFMD